MGWDILWGMVFKDLLLSPTNESEHRSIHCSTSQLFFWGIWMFKKNREIKECLRSFSASQSCLSWWKASLMWWVIKMMSNKSVVHWFRRTCFFMLSYTTSQGILVEPGHQRRLTLSEGRFFFPLESQIRDIVKRCWSCWTRRTTTGSTQKEFLYRREHSLNGRCWIIQVLNYSQKYPEACLISIQYQSIVGFCLKTIQQCWINTIPYQFIGFSKLIAITNVLSEFDLN